MGKTLELTCPSCNEEWQLRTGHGLAHATLENVLGAFPKEVQEKILSDTASERFPAFDFQYRPAICATCRKPVAAAEITLHATGATYMAPCPDCGATVSFFEEGADSPCPSCGQATLSIQDIGFWD